MYIEQRMTLNKIAQLHFPLYASLSIVLNEVKHADDSTI